MEGHTLADSLGEFPSSFPEIYRATIAASEQSGHLDTVLERLADYTENREELRSRTLGAMLYPVMLFIVCVAHRLLPARVRRAEDRRGVPQQRGGAAAADAGADRGQRLHARLRPDPVRRHRRCAIWLFRRWLRVEANRRRWHEFLLRLPLIGKVVRGSNTARFARTLSTLTASTVPVLDALRISGEVVTNLPMKAAVADAAVRVREGAPIGRSLGPEPPVPADDDPPDLERRIERRARHDARARRAAPGARTRLDAAGAWSACSDRS